MASKHKGLTKEEILDQVQKRAYEYETKYHGCSQATLLAIQEVFGLENETLFKAVSGLAGGVGRMQSTCGALLAGGLALGIKYGRELADLEKPQDIVAEKLNKSFEPVGKLYKWFEREFGTVICYEIRKSFLGVHLDSKIPWQRDMAQELGLYKRCSEIAGKTARRVAELMLEEEK